MGLWPVRGRGVHASQWWKASGGSEKGRWWDGLLLLQRDPRSAVLASFASGHCCGRTWCSSYRILGQAQGQRQNGGSQGERKSLGCNHRVKTEVANPGAYFFWF